jgi:hypothetical protein
MRDAKPTNLQKPDDRLPGPHSESEGEQAVVYLAQSALDGLEDLAAGRILNEAEFDEALSVTTARRQNS